MSEYSKLAEILRKSSLGEGSRGGNIIGHTRTGKPIYQGAHESHRDFSHDEHRDAMNHHYEIWSKTNNRIAQIRQQNPNWHPPKQIHDFLKHHYTQVQMHQAQMTKKESKPNANEMVKAAEITPFYSAVIIVDEEKKNFLLGKRLDDGIWTSPAGGAKKGEMPKQTALREIFEEANIVLTEGQLIELPMGYANNNKPVHVYLAQLSKEQMETISVVNDPDEEVKKWIWFPIDEKMPSPIDDNRFTSLLNAKMHLAGLMMKSYYNMDDMEGMSSVNMAEQAQASQAQDSFVESIERIMKDYEAGDEPVSIMINGNHNLHLVKIDAGLYSGFVKKNENDPDREVETVLNIDKMTAVDLVQMLRTKGIRTADEIGKQYASGMDYFANKLEEQERENEAHMALYRQFPEPQTLDEEDALSKLVDALRGMTVSGDVNIIIQKAKALPVGTVRQWGVYKYVKHSDGWVVIGGEHHGKLMGDFKSEPKYSDYARHHENSSAKTDDDSDKKKPAAEPEQKKPLTEDEEKQLASDLGKKAHLSGKKAVPAHDAELMRMIQGRKAGTSIHIFDAWSKAWHDSNHAKNPVPKPDPSGRPSPEDVKRMTAQLKQQQKKTSDDQKKKIDNDAQQAFAEADKAKQNQPTTVENEHGIRYGSAAQMEEEDKKNPPKEQPKEKEITPEQKKFRDDNAYMMAQITKSQAHTMSQEEFVASETKKKEQELIDYNMEKAPDHVTRQDIEQRVKAYIDKHKRTYNKTFKEMHKKHVDAAVQAGLDVADKAKAGYTDIAGSALPKEIDSELNTKTNMVKSVNFGNANKALATQFASHLNECNKLVESMGIKFKTPLAFRAIGIKTLGKRTRGTYIPNEKAIELKDMSAASKTLMHEIGHALDYAMQEGRDKGRHYEAVRGTKEMPAELSKLYEDLHNVVMNSDYYTSQTDMSHLRYLKDPTEVFARAFEVYSLHKAEGMNLSKEFMDTFVPDVFKTRDTELKSINEKISAASKELNDLYESDKEAYTAKAPEMRGKLQTLRSEYSKRLEQTKGWATVPEEKQKEYKTKISEIMSKILKTDEIRKSLETLDLALLLKGAAPAGGLPIGSMRMLNGKKFIKHGDGHWAPMPDEESASGQQAQQQEEEFEVEDPNLPEDSDEETAGPIDHLKPKEGFGGHVDAHSDDLKAALTEGPVSMISAGRNHKDPKDRAETDDKMSERSKRMEQDLKDKGYKYTKVRGQHGGQSESYMVYHGDEDHMNEIGKKYNQETVTHIKGGKTKIQHVSGENEGKHHKGEGFQEVPDAKDYFHQVKTSDGKDMKFSLKADYGKYHDEDSE